MAFISMLIIAMIYLGVILILTVIETVGKWQVYKKMGIPPWKCLVPYYNIYVEYKAVWRKELFFLWLPLTIGYVRRYRAIVKANRNSGISKPNGCYVFILRKDGESIR